MHCKHNLSVCWQTEGQIEVWSEIDSQEINLLHYTRKKHIIYVKAWLLRLTLADETSRIVGMSRYCFDRKKKNQILRVIGKWTEKWNINHTSRNISGFWKIRKEYICGIDNFGITFARLYSPLDIFYLCLKIMVNLFFMSTSSRM